MAKQNIAFERIVLAFLEQKNKEEENEGALEKLYEDPRSNVLMKYLATPPKDEADLKELYQLTCWGNIGTAADHQSTVSGRIWFEKS